MLTFCVGKDTILFITDEDQEDLQSTPLAKNLDQDAGDDGSEGFLGDEDEMTGAVGPDGEIDWDCPCLKGKKG